MSAKPFAGSTQKELQASGLSARAKYRSLFIGRKGWLPFLAYELVNLFVLPVPGALGLVSAQNVPAAHPGPRRPRGRLRPRRRPCAIRTRSKSATAP